MGLLTPHSIPYTHSPTQHLLVLYVTCHVTLDKCWSCLEPCSGICTMKSLDSALGVLPSCLVDPLCGSPVPFLQLSGSKSTVWLPQNPKFQEIFGVPQVSCRSVSESQNIPKVLIQPTPILQEQGTHSILGAPLDKSGSQEVLLAIKLRSVSLTLALTFGLLNVSASLPCECTKSLNPPVLSVSHALAH